MNLLLACLPLVLSSGLAVQDSTSVLEPSVPAVDVAVSEVLDKAFAGSHVPGAVAAILHFGEEPRVGQYGVRKVGAAPLMTVDDLVHIGSDTKAMTAVLIARLVDQGKMRWDMTIAEALPGIAGEIHEGFRSATVLDLLRHNSGAPANARFWWAFSKRPLHERRVALARVNLKGQPKGTPGERYEYSNLGVMVAGAMAEEVMGATWEDLMRREVFGPLGMASAGFGAPGAQGKIEQPWGHRMDDGVVTANQRDNAVALGPAGTVHISLRDWAKFAMQFTDRSAKESDYLSQASRAQLVEVGMLRYACGWGVLRRESFGGLVLTHSGSNTNWFAVIAVVPELNRAYLIAANAGGGSCSDCVQNATKMLVALDRAEKK